MDPVHHLLTADGEQLYGILRGLIGTQQAVFVVVTAAVYAFCQDLVQAVNLLRAAGCQKPLGPLTAVDIAGQDAVRILQDGFGIVGKDHLHLGPSL